MSWQFFGNLSGKKGLSAVCVVELDSTGVYIDDATVEPQLPDGTYQLEINGPPKRVVRRDGVWKESARRKKSSTRGPAVSGPD